MAAVLIIEINDPLTASQLDTVFPQYQDPDEAVSTYLCVHMCIYMIVHT